ncbi:MAG: tetratricopeptide repeat protein [Myxococcales bacterium]|nr:tetratricopeptide repeat protein [Myxococcales bacterium]
MRVSLGALLLTLALAPAVARAQAPTHHSAWSDYVTTPHDDVTAADARRFVRQGLTYLLLALSDRPVYEDPAHRELDRALLRFERARRLLPDDVDLAYYTAIALDRWRRPAPEGGIEYRADEAIAAFERVRELDPDYLPARVAFSLALLHARRGELDRVNAEYERALALDVPEAAVLMGRSYLPSPFDLQLATLYMSIDPSLVHGNLAENHMLLGDLDEAIRHYQIALRTVQGPMSRTLMHWGLALAHHRAGTPEAAEAEARAAIEADPFANDPDHVRIQVRWGALAVLHHADVFFEPAYEIHAYQAVGYEAFATMAERHRRVALEAALASWRRFLSEGGTTSRFAAHARAQVTRLERALADLPPAREVPLDGWQETTSPGPWLGPP